MKKKICVGIFMCVMIASVFARQPKAKIAPVEEISLKSCPFKLIDFYGGRVSLNEYGTPPTASYLATINSTAKRPFEAWIWFSCESAVPKLYRDFASVKLINNRWSLDLSNEETSWQLKTTLHLLHGKGWEGAGTTQDQSDGDEENRTRSFGFCIPHGARALCGSIPNVGYLTRLKESVLPQVIQLLESIEFIDPPAGLTSQTAALPTQ